MLGSPVKTALMNLAHEDSFMCKEYSGTHNSHIFLNSLDEFQINDSFNFIWESYEKNQVVSDLRSF